MTQSPDGSGKTPSHGRRFSRLAVSSLVIFMVAPFLCVLVDSAQLNRTSGGNALMVVAMACLVAAYVTALISACLISKSPRLLRGVWLVALSGLASGLAIGTALGKVVAKAQGRERISSWVLLIVWAPMIILVLRANSEAKRARGQDAKPEK